jgi:hypothetical protein
LPSLDVQGLTNLQVLNCNDSQLTSLNVQGLTNLDWLECYNNQLAILNVQGLTNLQTLYCQNNQLTSLNVQGLTNLQHLYCTNNQLTNLNVQGLTNLYTLNCGNNQLPSLNVQGLTNLQELYCHNNQLASLNVQGLTSLRYLDCSINQLTELYIKNGINEGFLIFSNNPSLVYICADDTQIASVQQEVTAQGLTNCVVNDYCSFTPGGQFYTIQGNTRFDIDNNGCTPSDPQPSYQKYTITNGTLQGSTIGYNGSYNFAMQSDTYTWQPYLQNPNYFTALPATATVTFPNALGTTHTQDFCITPVGTYRNLEISLLPLTPARPGFDATYRLVYTNKGNQIETGTVSAFYDDSRLDWVSSSIAPTTQATGHLTWDFSNLLPFETRSIDFTLNLNSPMETPPVNNGDTIIFNANIQADATNPADNAFVLKQTVVNSYDPNDKTCLEGEYITPSMVGDYVHYLIRFENTGTFAAENIVVKDLIDTTRFDIRTLEVIETSHPTVFKMRTNENKVEFIFENIQLDFNDATNDGFVAFKIKTNNTLVVGNQFKNKAEIYFDYNFPIITNEYISTVRNKPFLPISIHHAHAGSKDQISISPNPVLDVAELYIDTTQKGERTYNVYNPLGSLLQTNTVMLHEGRNAIALDLSAQPQGLYLVTVSDGYGTKSYKIVKK